MLACAVKVSAKDFLPLLNFVTYAVDCNTKDQLIDWSLLSEHLHDAAEAMIDHQMAIKALAA
jgi:hypothetical protein